MGSLKTIALTSSLCLFGTLSVGSWSIESSPKRVVQDPKGCMETAM